MIETTKIWEVYSVSFDTPVKAKTELNKKYGSKRSGTIYLVADTKEEAEEIAKELFTRNGYTPPKKITIIQTHLIKQALRMIK